MEEYWLLLLHVVEMSLIIEGDTAVARQSLSDREICGRVRMSGKNQQSSKQQEFPVHCLPLLLIFWPGPTWRRSSGALHSRND